MSNPTCRCSASAKATSSADYLEAKKDKKKKAQLGYGETFLSDTAQEWHSEWQDHPRKMWTSAEHREELVRKNKIGEDKDGNPIYTKPRSAQKIIIALPIEGSHDEHITLCRKLAEEFRKEGRCGQWRIHYDKQGNPHAHFLLTVRKVDRATGLWEDCKVKREPVLDANGNKIQAIDKEGNPVFRKNSAGRTIKVYQYRKIEGYNWDSKNYLQTHIRDKWEEIQNEFLRSKGLPECSLKKLDADKPRDERRTPTRHEGWAPEHQAKAQKWNADAAKENAALMERLRKGEKIYDTADGRAPADERADDRKQPTVNLDDFFAGLGKTEINNHRERQASTGIDIGAIAAASRQREADRTRDLIKQREREIEQRERDRQAERAAEERKRAAERARQAEAERIQREKQAAERARKLAQQQSAGLSR